MWHYMQLLLDLLLSWEVAPSMLVAKLQAQQ
jgi:hypothetical protein